MTREFIMTPVFDKLWDNMGLTDEDLRKLQSVLMETPEMGDIIKGTGGEEKFALLYQVQAKAMGQELFILT